MYVCMRYYDKICSWDLAAGCMKVAYFHSYNYYGSRLHRPALAKLTMIWLVCELNLYKLYKGNSSPMSYHTNIFWYDTVAQMISQKLSPQTRTSNSKIPQNQMCQSLEDSKSMRWKPHSVSNLTVLVFTPLYNIPLRCWWSKPNDLTALMLMIELYIVFEGF